MLKIRHIAKPKAVSRNYYGNTRMIHLIRKTKLGKPILVILVLIYSCSEQKQNNSETFIVPIRQKPSIDTTRNSPPLPPPIQTYYLESNFIIDTAGRLYFYQQSQYGWFCGTGIEWDTPPDFIDLKPKDIVQVPAEGVEMFIKLNILTLDSSDRRVSIASLRDTFQSASLSRMMLTFRDSTNRIKWLFRKATQEETTVLEYKQGNREYNADEIEWDLTSIRLPLESKIKFAVPKVLDK